MKRTQSGQFFEHGWVRFPHDRSIAEWVHAALPAARRAVSAPQNAEWLRYQATWFAGVNALDNDERGAVPGGPPLTGDAVAFVTEKLAMHCLSWDRGQVSVCYPGYPKASECETGSAFRYRRDRDAAHLDGLLPEGPKRRRHLREHHGFILGIPMVEASTDASPLVVWEGSHEIIRSTFRRVFEQNDPSRWGEIDVTDVYREARREIFETCNRVPVTARPGEVYLVHRLALHGVAPWAPTAAAGPDGRMIVYFRPDIGDAGRWLSDP